MCQEPPLSRARLRAHLGQRYSSTRIRGDHRHPPSATPCGACGAALPYACLRASCLAGRKIRPALPVNSASVNAHGLLTQMTVTSRLYKFIKRYPIPPVTREAVDVTPKYVYVAARNLVFGLTCCHAPGFGLRLK